MDFPQVPGYKVEKVLGQGGMACVYLAIQENFERHVALKVMAEHLIRDESFAKRFLREAKTVARLSHQSIVPVFDVGAVGNIHYMAMEFLPGGDLKHKMRQGLSLLDSIRIVKAISSGLNYAGKKGLVHRDIKPENILFREDNSPVISDFGIVRDTDSKTNMTVTGAVIGTPHYMSPEQAEGVAVDPRSDLYSLGVILYEMLTGHVPFTGESAVSIGIKHITEMPEALPQDVAGFQKIIDIILAKHPDDRFQTGDEFIEALEDLESSLSDSGAKTVVMSVEDIRRSSRGKQTGRTSARRTSAARTNMRGRTSMRQQAEDDARRKSRTIAAASVLSVAVTMAAAGGFWYMNQYDDGSQRGPVVQIEELDPVLKSKTDELITQARTAMQEGRLFDPPNDNAQHYLTTLLALFPDHPEGKQEIEALFSNYMTKASEATEKRNLTDASGFLNQASQISFYINSSELQDEFASLHRSLNNLRQKALISQEKQRLIDALLVKADKALKKDALTAPADQNAYDLYQQVLVEDQSNILAIKGLENIATRFLQKARDQANGQSFGPAKAFVAAAVQVYAEHAEINQVQALILQKEEEEAKRQLASENRKIAELDKARADREASLKQKQKMVSDWLQAAEIAFKDNRLTSPADGNALAYYEKVLEVEPANIRALQGKEKVGSRFVELGLESIKRNEFEVASKHLESASAIVSSNVDISRAYRELDARKEQKKVEDIIARGNKALAADQLMLPEKDNALFYYEQALSQDSGNVAAQQGKEKVGMRFIELAKAAIGKNQFSAAEQHLGNAREISSSVVEIEVATNMLGQAKMALKSAEERKKALAEQKRIEREKKAAAAAKKKLSRTESLLADAKKISRRKATSESNDKLRTIYQSILKTSSKNRTAIKGLLKTSDFEAKQARLAIDQRNFSRALQHIALISATTPKYSKLQTLRDELSETQAGHDKATTLLGTAAGLIAKPYEKPGLFGSNKGARETLKRAYSNIDQARKTDAKHPELKSTLADLESKYVSILRLLAKDGDFDDAKDFMKDARAYNWPNEKFVAMESEITASLENSKSRAPKAIGGF